MFRVILARVAGSLTNSGREIGRALDVVGRDRVDLDVVATEFLGERHGERVGGPARRHVHRVIRQPPQGRRRGDEQDFTALARLHLRHDRTGHLERKDHHVFERRTQFVRARRLDRRADRGARVVADDNVDPAASLGCARDDLGRRLRTNDGECGIGRSECLRHSGIGEALVVADHRRSLSDELGRDGPAHEMFHVGDQDDTVLHRVSYGAVSFAAVTRLPFLPHEGNQVPPRIVLHEVFLRAAAAVVVAPVLAAVTRGRAGYRPLPPAGSAHPSPPSGTRWTSPG